MTVVEERDPFDAARALRASGVLRAFNDAGVLTAADVHVATTLGRLTPESNDDVLLAIALAVRAVREGSVCVDLHEARSAAADVADEVTLPWPADVERWYDALRASPAVAVGADGDVDADRPARLVGRLLYLDRYWRQEELVRSSLTDRAAAPVRDVDADALRAAVRAQFAEPDQAMQRLAAAAVALGGITIVAGGPGTGKTTTIKALLAVLDEVWPLPPRVALAAPTGKAAARLQEAVGRPASTLHRLLGSKPGSHTRFRHDADNQLPYDVIVVDETSMVSLTLMSRLLEAVRPAASLVLVGDPDQLASVEAGAVLGDLVGRAARPGPDPRAEALGALLPDDIEAHPDAVDELRRDVVRLRHVYRHGGTIAAIAAAIRAEDPDEVLRLLASSAADVEFMSDVDLTSARLAGVDALRADVASAGEALVTAARSGDAGGALAALNRHRLLCGHRSGPFGVRRWSGQVERWIADAAPGYAREGGDWYVGRPLIVTANDYDAKLYNGDTGVVVARDDEVRAVFGRGDEVIDVPVHRLGDIESVHAMTVHRSQGSQFERVTVVLPPADSPLLTRELLYTAVTRAEAFVRVVGSADAVRAAVRKPVRRASGLR